MAVTTKKSEGQRSKLVKNGNILANNAPLMLLLVHLLDLLVTKSPICSCEAGGGLGDSVTNHSV